MTREPFKLMKRAKTIERNIYLEVQDTTDGNKILDELVYWLTGLKHRNPEAYLNGWMGPVTKSKKPKTKKSK